MANFFHIVVLDALLERLSVRPSLDRMGRPNIDQRSKGERFWRSHWPRAVINLHKREREGVVWQLDEERRRRMKESGRRCCVAVSPVPLFLPQKGVAAALPPSHAEM